MAETWKKVAFEDDVLLKSVFDANSIVMATDDNTPIVLAVAANEVVGRAAGAIDGIAVGIADTNIVRIDGTANDTEWAIFNAAGLEGLTDAEAIAALSGNAAAAFDWADQNLTSIGSLYLTEKADAAADIAADGQVWVNTATPNELWFTTDAGNDIQITSGTVLASPVHAMLDGSVHSDSVADAVTRGSIIYGNATPKWDELVVGGADTFLGSDGTDLSYRTAAQVMASLSAEAAAAFSFGGQEIQDFVIHTVADDAAKTALTQAVGNLVWQADVAALYFCTVAV